MKIRGNSQYNIINIALIHFLTCIDVFLTLHRFHGGSLPWDQFHHRSLVIIPLCKKIKQYFLLASECTVHTLTIHVLVAPPLKVPIAPPSSATRPLLMTKNLLSAMPRVIGAFFPFGEATLSPPGPSRLMSSPYQNGDKQSTGDGLQWRF